MKKVFFLFFLFFILIKPVWAVEFGADVAASFKISDPDAVNGDIVSSGSQGLTRSKNDYDLRAFGVIVNTATVLIRSVDPTFKPIVQAGTALVNVTDVNGPVKTGNYVTTSAKNPGKGQKATISGYVIGVALSDLSGNQGTVLVAVKPEYTEISNARTLARLLDYFTAGLFKNIADQGQFPMVMRYIIAGLVMLACVAISFLTFSRSVPKAIEAIGRNPLAKSSIMISLALSIGLVIATLVLGLIATVIILRV